MTAFWTNHLFFVEILKSIRWRIQQILCLRASLVACIRQNIAHSRGHSRDGWWLNQPSFRSPSPVHATLYKCSSWQILNRHQFGTLPAWKLSINEVTNLFSQAGSVPNRWRFNIYQPLQHSSGKQFYSITFKMFRYSLQSLPLSLTSVYTAYGCVRPQSRPRA